MANHRSRQIHCLALLLIFHLAIQLPAHGQCNGANATFPYYEDFETGRGGWIPGGLNSDWAWGHPQKNIINKAASGNNCWVIGGLLPGGYAANQTSVLTSPCFNFSLLEKPVVRFKIFWETQRSRDGASFEYSKDGGNTWSVLGSYKDFNTCPAYHWYNFETVEAIKADGWSGTGQNYPGCGSPGSPSNGWVLSQHDAFQLAGQKNVRFRFIFDSDGDCNQYDGVAVDDIWIGESPIEQNSFSYTCSAGNKISFVAGAPGCGPTFSWNFGDAASPDNTSTEMTPDHVFSGPGMYQVQLVTSIPGQGDITTIKSVQVFDVKLNVLKQITCFGQPQGSIEATVNGSGNFFYFWDQLPGVNAARVNNLDAGAYSLTVAGDGECRARAGVVLTQPEAIAAVLDIEGSTCGLPNGNVHAQVSGGTAPYNYEWLPGGPGSEDLEAIRGGSYALIIRDANACADTIPFLVKDTTPLKVNLGPDLGICDGQQLVISGGQFASYLWQDGSTQSTLVVKEPGTYSLRGFDASGCSATDTITVEKDCSEPYYPNAFTPNNDGRNDDFGPIGNLSLLTSYRLIIWNRWGTQVFTSTDPHVRWKGNGQTGQTFVWSVEYGISGSKGLRLRRGTVTIVR